MRLATYSMGVGDRFGHSGRAQLQAMNRHIAAAKGADAFITEVSMGETHAPQTPPDLLVMLAAEMGARYTDALAAYAPIVARHVTHPAWRDDGRPDHRMGRMGCRR